MKKYFMMMVAVLAAMTMFTLSSCGDDDDNGNGSSTGGIVGDWATVQFASDGTYMFIERLIFSSNGSFSGVDYAISGQDLNNSGTVSDIEKASFFGTYVASNGTLTMTVNGQTQQVTYKVSGSTLTLTTNGVATGYDKVDSNISSVINSVEQAYQNLHK